MTNVMEAAEGSSGAQQCLRGCCRIHWGAVIQQSSAGEREHLEASVGVEQPIPRVNVNQSKRVRGRGDQGLGLERSAVQSKPSLQHQRRWFCIFWVLSSSLALLFASS